jgi:predicted  nucleic acid-binding Zn-ribbon protein
MRLDRKKEVVALALFLILLAYPALGRDYGAVGTFKLDVSPGEVSSKSIEITRCEIESGCSGSITLSTVSDVRDWIALSPSRFDLSGLNYMNSYPANVTVSAPSSAQLGKYTAKIAVESGSDTWSYNLNITVKNPDGKITISSEPSGALLYLDGIYIGTTPLSLDVPVGTHTLNTSKDGYEEWTQNIVVNPGEVKNVSATLIQKGGLMENLGLLLVVIAVVLVGGVAVIIYGGPAIGKIKPKLVQARSGIAKLRNAGSESFKRSVSIGAGKASSMKNLLRSPERKITPTPEFKSGFGAKRYTAGTEGEEVGEVMVDEDKSVHHVPDVHLGSGKELAEGKALKAELKRMQADIEDLRKNSETKISAVEQVMAYIGDKVESLKTSLDSIVERGVEVKTVSQGVSREFVEAESAKVRGETETLKSAILGLKKSVDEIMQNLNAMKESFGNKIEELSDEVRNKVIDTASLAVTKTEGVELSEELGTLKKELSEIRNSLSDKVQIAPEEIKKIAESSVLLEELGALKKEIGELKGDLANIHGSETVEIKGIETLKSAFIGREEFTELSEGISSVASAINDELVQIRDAIASLRQMTQKLSPQELYLRHR